MKIIIALFIRLLCTIPIVFTVILASLLAMAKLLKG